LLLVRAFPEGKAMRVDYRNRETWRKPSTPAPRVRLNPLFARHIRRSAKRSCRLAITAGFTSKQALYNVLREDRVSATDVMVTRLYRIADQIGFARDFVFLDELAR
jgi:hypothetical protein